jgi:ABC-type nitrate/sulfonate/bicarbonate transport system substrate-binding protein
VFSNFEGVEAAHRGLAPRVFTLADWGVPDFCQLHFITRPAVLAAEGDAIRRFFAVVRRAVAFALAEPAEARRIYDAETGGSLGDALSAAIFAETVPAFRAEMDLPPAYWQSLADWLLATGQIDAPLPIGGAWLPAASLS